MAYDHEYFRNMDSHPSTKVYDTDFDVIASQADWLKPYYDNTPDYSQVTGITPGKVYHVHKAESFGDPVDYYVINDNGAEQRLGSFFFEALPDDFKKEGESA